MRRSITAAALAAPLAALALWAAPAGAETFVSSGVSAAELLSPCQEADNDSRWGAAAETECEQYVIGFMDAMARAGRFGAETGVCPPAVNTADEVRWAFMRWVHGDYSARTVMSAAEALEQTVATAFPCE